MKTRLGFVSNSSSSSFICIGTEDDALIKKLLKAEGIKKEKGEDYYETSYGQIEGKTVTFCGNGYEGDFQCAGVVDDELESILEDHSLRETRTIVKNLIKEGTGVEIPDDKIVFIHDEASDE